MTINRRYKNKNVPASDADIDQMAIDAEATTVRIAEINKEQSTRDAKMTGVEIEGVMASATSDDQNGLVAIGLDFVFSQSSGTRFEDTFFKFQNGNELLITSSNFETVRTTWTAFRRSFFVE